jgi:hypothetical protein
LPLPGNGVTALPPLDPPQAATIDAIVTVAANVKLTLRLDLYQALLADTEFDVAIFCLVFILIVTFLNVLHAHIDLYKHRGNKKYLPLCISRIIRLAQFMKKLK